MAEEQSEDPYEERYGELLDICASHARTLIAQSAQIIEMQARLDALGIMVRILSTAPGLSAEACGSLLARLGEAFHQRRLDILEDANPAAAASADTRAGIPDLDADLMDLIRQVCGDEGREP